MCSVTLYSFFFSSRRRHTSLQGDWSSDVCSSDLALQGPCAARRFEAFRGQPHPARLDPGDRSEERRVGKECRSGWEWERSNKKKRTGGNVEKEALHQGKGRLFRLTILSDQYRDTA